jgi:hypothetical protein
MRTLMICRFISHTRQTRFGVQFSFTAHHCNPEEEHYRNTKITTYMPKLTGVAGAFAAVAVEAPLDDALA